MRTRPSGRVAADVAVAALRRPEGRARAACLGGATAISYAVTARSSAVRSPAPAPGRRRRRSPRGCRPARRAGAAGR
ncbi:hypothetical protein CP976_06220 [Streptomyces coeruleorubidus]|uniref:Uncharacterized protein n=1 Tax=Streptomyces coeruleorubidus TaxID=116188 RepID=A0A5J6HTV7_STRC4|nr:hypothetical protein CP976_06220 [Streptomyces coeruleorubidus]